MKFISVLGAVVAIVGVANCGVVERQQVYTKVQPTFDMVDEGCMRDESIGTWTRKGQCRTEDDYRELMECICNNKGLLKKTSKNVRKKCGDDANRRWAWGIGKFCDDMPNARDRPVHDLLEWSGLED